MVKRVLIISNVPQHYRIALLNELSLRLEQKDIELKVVFAAPGYKRRKSNIDLSEIIFKYEILKSFKFHLGNIEKTMFTYRGVSKLFSSYKPDKTIVTGYSIATLRLWLLSFIKPVNYMIWSGSIDRPGQLNSGARLWLRRQFIKRSSGCVAYGSKAKEYLIAMGAKAENVFIGINTVDTTFYADQTESLRVKLPPSRVHHLTYIGYLSARKKAIQLIEVIKLLSQQRQDFILDLIGDGDTKQEMMDYVTKENLEKFVCFHGFVQKPQLPEHLARSSCFLFQTGFDIWGLVLNEAMAAGVPCIASPNAGAVYDLIKEEETGYICDFNNTLNVVDKIQYLLNHPEKAREMGQKSAAFIRTHASVSNSVNGFMNAIEH